MIVVQIAGRAGRGRRDPSRVLGRQHKIGWNRHRDPESSLIRKDLHFSTSRSGLECRRITSGKVALAALKNSWLVLAMVTISLLPGAPVTPAFSLTDVDGQLHTLADWKGKRAIVLVFVTTDCPLSNSYVPELNRLQQTYASQGVVFYAVQGDATVADEDVRRHVKDFAYIFPYLLDPRESLAAFTGASSTPEAAVLSSTGELLYRGRIDNRLEDFGKQRVQITEHDLKDALDAVLAGKPVPHPRTKALGCAITAKN